jgi:hypothetical protein
MVLCWLGLEAGRTSANGLGMGTSCFVCSNLRMRTLEVEMKG